jgi:hypothetical protein
MFRPRKRTWCPVCAKYLTVRSHTEDELQQYHYASPQQPPYAADCPICTLPPRRNNPRTNANDWDCVHTEDEIARFHPDVRPKFA